MVVVCKSYRIFHNKSNKIGFVFFWFFYEFYKIQQFHLDLEETVLRTGPRISHTGPRDKKLDCNWVPGAMAGGGSSIPARGRLGSTGKGWGSAHGLTYDRFWGLDGSEGVPARGSADGRTGGHWSSGSGELSVGEREWAARSAPVGATGGLGATSRMRRHAEAGARRCWPHWHTTDGSRAVACARMGRQRLLWPGQAGAAPSHRGDGTTRLQCRGTATDLGGPARQRGARTDRWVRAWCETGLMRGAGITSRCSGARALRRRARPRNAHDADAEAARRWREGALWLETVSVCPCSIVFFSKFLN
jgi:hypothetical protein